MPVRSSEAEWNGNLQQGTGHMRFGQGAFDGAFSFSSRFEEGTGTNPEELIAAAHAGCFSMQLSGILGRAGFDPQRVATTARVHIDKGEAGFSITRIQLQTEAEIPGIDDARFQEIAEEAKKTCPVSRALAAVSEIDLTAKLV